MINIDLEEKLIDMKYQYQLKYCPTFYLVALPLTENMYQIELTNVRTETKTIYRPMDSGLRQIDNQIVLYKGKYDIVKWLYLSILKNEMTLVEESDFNYIIEIMNVVNGHYE